MKSRHPSAASRRVQRALAGLAGLLLLALALPAAAAPGAAPAIERAPGQSAQLRRSGLSSAARVPAPPAQRRAQQATFVVNYDAGFQANPTARAAFQHAVDIWSQQLSSPTPIVVDAQWLALAPGLLGSAGSGGYVRNFPGAPQANTWYPIALANRLAGADLDPDGADVEAQFNSAMPWYFGTDGQTPVGQVDFVSVVLHELGHGLGFAGAGRVSGGLGYYTLGAPATPLGYDRLVVDGLGAALMLLPNGSVALASQLTSGGLYFGGANAVAANDGSRPRLYAPGTWSQGSSYSHLDEATYPPGNPNALMTPYLDDGESAHDPGPIARGIFTDLGWTISGPASTPTPTATATSTPTPSSTPVAPTTPAAGTIRLFVPNAARSVGL